MNCPKKDGAASNRPPARTDAEQLGAVPTWKRVLDLSCLLVAAPVVLPLCLAIGAFIKLVSPGPPFFTQERVGYRGRPFKCFKFRSMVDHAETGVHEGHFLKLMKSDDPMVKLDAQGDQRLIPGGLWLRSLGLDELPQLLNVLRGDMSLVGPRPCLEYERAAYDPKDLRRFDTLPGLTGYWQIKGKSRTTFEEMMRLDIYYVEHQSLLFDLSIMARTLPAIIGQVVDLRLKKRRGARPPGTPRAQGSEARRVAPAKVSPEQTAGKTPQVTE